MTEELIFIPSGKIKLEAKIKHNDPNRGAVVAHPHPLYGGSMHDFVVSLAVSALAEAGWTVLRFNFRGVGQSEGTFDEGVGEAEDLAAAAGYLKENGMMQILVAGYSFGASIALKAWPQLKGLDVQPLILIALPAALMSFDFVQLKPEVGLMICGGRDDIAPPDLARALGAKLLRPIEPVIIPGADHFFGGGEEALTHALKTYLHEEVS
ncbi:MAG: alpha/beta hydrolase [Deltaproteobacteria bacterium]|nr:alpha/beta hydrolase [Deltaproteobacteria bacterium]MBW2084505.1 alpha/beta hydrolase [Deltaproteobacteria bacterium]